MKHESGSIESALALSGEGLAPAEGWQEEVVGRIHSRAKTETQSGRRWFRPAAFGGLVTVMSLFLVPSFLANQSSNREAARAAEEVAAEKMATSQKELRGLAEERGLLEEEGKMLDQEIQEALLAVADSESRVTSARVSLQSSVEDLDKLAQEVEKALKEADREAANQKNSEHRLAKAKDEAALSLQMQKAEEMDKAIAKRVLALWQLKRRVQAAKTLSARRSALAKSAARAKRRAAKKKFNKCANSSDPLCGL